MQSQYSFTTADLIDIAPDTPSCETQFKLFGQKKRFLGKIRTLRCLNDNALIKQIFNNPSDHEVLVIDGHASLYSALIGDQIAEAGLKNGWAGAIVNGVIRDTMLINKLDFGIKALGSNPRKSTKLATGERDVILSFGHIDFIPGYYLYSDEDGILVSEQNLIPVMH